MRIHNQTGKGHLLLSTRTAISPDVPVLIQSLLFSHLPNVRTSDTFIVTIVPLPDVFGNLNAGIAFESGAPTGVIIITRSRAVCLPWQVFEPEVKQLKRSLSSLAGRYESVRGIVSTVFV